MLDQCCWCPFMRIRKAERDNGCWMWGVCGNLMGCGLLKQWPKSNDRRPIINRMRRGSFLVHLSDCKWQSHCKVKSEFIVFVCTLMSTYQWNMISKFQYRFHFQMYYCCSQSSLKTHTALPQSSFWKAALRLNKAKDQPALHGHSGERDLGWIGPDSDLTATAAERSAS